MCLIETLNLCKTKCSQLSIIKCYQWWRWESNWREYFSEILVRSTGGAAPVTGHGAPVEHRSQMAELHNRHARLQPLLPLILKLYLAPGADNNNQIMMVTRTYFPTCQALMLLWCHFNGSCNLCVNSLEVAGIMFLTWINVVETMNMGWLCSWQVDN